MYIEIWKIERINFYDKLNFFFFFPSYTFLVTSCVGWERAGCPSFFSPCFICKHTFRQHLPNIDLTARTVYDDACIRNCRVNFIFVPSDNFHLLWGKNGLAQFFLGERMD